MRDVDRTRQSRAIPFDRAWSEISREDFFQAVAALPSDFRIVFELQAFGRKACDEIAAHLEITREAVEARLRQARALLTRALRSPVPA